MFSILMAAGAKAQQGTHSEIECLSAASHLVEFKSPCDLIDWQIILEE